MNCIRHPDRKAFSICQKHHQGYCEECCACADPQGYCKYRSQCIGWQVCHKKTAKSKGHSVVFSTIRLLVVFPPPA
jgi:hypothetical protein